LLSRTSGNLELNDTNIRLVVCLVNGVVALVGSGAAVLDTHIARALIRRGQSSESGKRQWAGDFYPQQLRSRQQQVSSINAERKGVQIERLDLIFPVLSSATVKSR
jgi:hypothetical protein